MLLSSDYSMPSAYNAQIWTMNDATGAMKRLSPADAPTGFFTNYNEFAQFTPDGSRIVFGRTKGDKQGMDYWTMRPDGSDVRRLTFTGASWHTSHQGYGNVGGFGFDPRNPRRIFAGRTTDLAAKSIDGYFIDTTSGGLTGTYYTDRSLTRKAGTVTENPSDGLDFSSPPVRDLPDSHYGVRWTGALRTRSAGTYTFANTADSTSSLTITIDGKRLKLGADSEATTTLKAGTHKIAIEYVDGGTGGYLQLLWQPPGTTTPAPIPVEDLSATG